jgi:dTDP-4-dehydrorhamnose reductase
VRPVLVIGAGGQLGRELMLRRDAARWPIVGFSRGELDIRDRDGVRRAITDTAPALVINAAAYTEVDKAESECQAAFAVNRDGPANLATACAEAAIPLLHVSTDYVFDGRKEGPYVESDPAAPLSVYGASKLAGEEAVRACLEQHVILRTAWVFGAHGANFVKTIARLAGERPEFGVVDDQLGGPTPAGSIAEALLAVADATGTGNARWGTYHFCGAPATSRCGFARAIVDAAGPYLGRRIVVRPVAAADHPLPARRPANSVLDCGKIGEAFGIVPRPWRAALAEVVRELYASSS